MTQPSTLSKLALPAGLKHQRIDGSNVLTVYEATQEALQHARAGQGSTLLEACVTRAQFATSSANDPLTCCAQLLQTSNGWDETWASELEQRLRAEIEQACKGASGDGKGKH